MIMSRQLEWNRLVMRVQQNEYGFSLNPLAGFIDIFNHVAAPEHPQTADETGIPALIGHLLFRRIEPRDVLDLCAADAPPLEKLSPCEDRLLAAELRQKTDEI